MDPDSVKSTLSNLAFGNVMAAAARDYQKGVAFDRIVGFEDLGHKDDFTTRTFENLLRRKGVIDERKTDEDDCNDDINRSVRSSAIQDSDSD